MPRWVQIGLVGLFVWLVITKPAAVVALGTFVGGIANGFADGVGTIIDMLAE